MTMWTVLGALLSCALGGILGYLWRGRTVHRESSRAEALLAAAQAHRADSERILEQAAERTLHQQAQTQAVTLNHTLQPVQQTLFQLANRLQSAEREQAKTSAEVLTAVAGVRDSSQQVTATTHQLLHALQNPGIRGRWGEIQLERIVELAGMTKHCDFSTQHTTAAHADATAGHHRPDLVVHLSGGRNLVVDAKVPAEPWAAAVDAGAEVGYAAKTAARALKAHIDTLKTKQYWRSLSNSPEFVVLFTPGEAFLDAALSERPALWEYAMEANVVLATPTTLIALLRTVAMGWRHEALTHDAEHILELGRTVYHRLTAMTRQLDQLGASLNRSVGAYNGAIQQWEQEVLPSGMALQRAHTDGTAAPAAPRQVRESVASAPRSAPPQAAATGARRH